MDRDRRSSAPPATQATAARCRSIRVPNRQVGHARSRDTRWRRSLGVPAKRAGGERRQWSYGVTSMSDRDAAGLVAVGCALWRLRSDSRMARLACRSARSSGGREGHLPRRRAPADVPPLGRRTCSHDCHPRNRRAPTPRACRTAPCRGTGSRPRDADRRRAPRPSAGRAPVGQLSSHSESVPGPSTPLENSSAMRLVGSALDRREESGSSDRSAA